MLQINIINLCNIAIQVDRLLLHYKNRYVYSLPMQIEIWKIKLKCREMTFDGGSCSAYNPEGDKIVYTNSNINEGELWIVNSDGSNKHKLTKLQK